jgi:4'-phosphopantetheinyl transferase
MKESLGWLLQHLEDVPEGDDWLAEGERRVSDALRFAKRRRDWRLGRWTAKRALLGFLATPGLESASLEVRAAADGAPEAVQNGAPLPVALSISHSGACGLCAVAAAPLLLGCDIERLEERGESLVRDYFTPGEAAYCLGASGETGILRANLVWSAKESVLKALRAGLRRDTRSVEVDPGPEAGGERDGWNPWTGRCLESGRLFFGWWRAREGYVLTLASDREGIPEEAGAGREGSWL